MTRLQLLAVQVAVVLLCWWGFSTYYDRKGYARCQAEHATAQAKANADLVARERGREAEGRSIGDDARRESEGAVREIEQRGREAEERIEVIYRDRWREAPAGGCAMPLDPRVQAEIDAAVRRTQ